jgi:adenosylcobinamide-GDP ribazoletransferase
LPVDEAAARAPADGAPPADAPPAGALRRARSSLTLAVAFLTILPVRPRSLDLGAAAAWFPAVGAVVGALAGGVRAGADPLFGHAAASVLGLVALVAVTGALHQDGLADTADGLGVRADRERRLAVMRDPAIGAFGVLALIGWALLLLAALTPLTQPEGLVVLIATGALSRWAALIHAKAIAPARLDGLGAGFAVHWPALAFATVCAVAAAGLAAGPGPGAVALAAALAIAGLSAVAARRAIGGRTGDTIGATVAVVEVAVCLSLSALV